MESLSSAGVDPPAYIERLLHSATFSNETDAQREARWERLRAEEAEGMRVYDELIERDGLRSDDLQAF